ncbi:hypothetical protein PFISCL1PPCAC_23669, partial [Pristionchus fissidentatus]
SSEVMNRSGLPSSGGPSTSSGMGGGMGPSSLPSTTTTTNNTGDGRGSQVTKVAEVFLTAGHAFQRLGDLTLQLQGEAGAGENDESKWMEADISKLRDALTRFAHELDTISESVQQRTMKHIKVDIKRRTLVGDDTMRRGNSPAVNMGGMPIGGTMGGGGGGQKRGAHLMSMPPSGLPAKRIAATSYTKFQPYSSTMGGGGMGGSRLTAASRPPTSYLTDASLSGGGVGVGGGPPSLTPLATPLLSEPSHHYINTR